MGGRDVQFDDLEMVLVLLLGAEGDTRCTLLR